ncbi:hypothetical protein LTR09_002144 [Extremus antarcticus]|uniref:Uncharacterized protein n=1 Tax=Extremus antarcticus TaxID=702011 RepID=A0AAJ0LVW6_9PEZI|nr:hypothetical protein LTR09_002144 [Extremus antarcticus]
MSELTTDQKMDESVDVSTVTTSPDQVIKDDEATTGASKDDSETAKANAVNGDQSQDAAATATANVTDHAEDDVEKNENGANEKNQTDGAANGDSKEKKKQDRMAENDRKFGGDRKWIAPIRKIVSKFDNLPESDDPVEIRKQVDFYFSEFNLPTDKHLWQLAGGRENKPVDVSVIHSFKRMQHFQPRSAVVAALKDSKLLNIDDSGAITRKEPLDEVFTDDLRANEKIVHERNMSRTVYAKYFGDEEEDTHQRIEEYFAPYGPVNSIRLRRWEDGVFKGSVFVEFASEELQKKFLGTYPKPDFGDQQPEFVSKREYVDTEHKGKVERLVQQPKKFDGKPFRGGKNKSSGRGGRRNDDRDGDRGDRNNDKRYDGSRYGKGGRDNKDRDGRKKDRGGDREFKGDRDEWKKRREHDQEEKGGAKRKRGGDDQDDEDKGDAKKPREDDVVDLTGDAKDDSGGAKRKREDDAEDEVKGSKKKRENEKEEKTEDLMTKGDDVKAKGEHTTEEDKRDVKGKRAREDDEAEFKRKKAKTETRAEVEAKDEKVEASAEA